MESLYWINTCKDQLKAVKLGEEDYEITCKAAWECTGCSCNHKVRLNFNPCTIKNYKEVYSADLNKPEELEMKWRCIRLTKEVVLRELKPYFESSEEWWFFTDYVCDLDTIIVFQEGDETK